MRRKYWIAAMPLEWTGIVKSGNLLKSPPFDAQGRPTGRWRTRYFVLYDPSEITIRTHSNVSKRSNGSDDEFYNTTPSPPVSWSSPCNRRRKSSIIAGNILRHFRPLNAQVYDASDIDKATLIFFDSAEKEMKGALPRSKKKQNFFVGFFEKL
jgi:hypothetical protein